MNLGRKTTSYVTQPGTYWVRIYNDCGELTDTIQVRDNVEITLATCDLETNLNMVTWQTTTAQAEYVDHLKVKRDGTECPITSYPKETIHMAYLTGINNTIEVNWNIPTGYDLMGYNICEWNPNGELTVIDYVGLGEQTTQNFKVYPNPSTGSVTLEGTGRVTIANVLGQTVNTLDIDGQTTIELPQGVWFVKLGETTRKVMVE